MTERPDATLRSLRRQFLLGLAVCGLLLGGGVAWAAVARLSGAIIAAGTLVVDSALKVVQHPTGGVVGELLVGEGDRVEAGQVLIRLDETVTRANLAVVTKTLDEMAVRRARLEAERDGLAAVAFPDALLRRAAVEPLLGKILEGERTLFAARAEARAGEKAQLGESVAQLQKQIEGLAAQEQAKDEQIALIASELEGVEELYKKHLVTYARVTVLQREASSLKGERGQIVAAAAEAAGRIAETRLKILQIDQDLRSEVLKELRDIDDRTGELVERQVAAEDQLKRIEIRSPQVGTVLQLAVHTVGGVISPGEVLMSIVPDADPLSIEARIAPGDIDYVTTGQGVVIRLSAFSQSRTPELLGQVRRVSADIAKDDKENVSFYGARIDFAPGELQRLPPGLVLVAGMPAEVHIQTGDRSALSYLLKPLEDHFGRAFREQ